MAKTICFTAALALAWTAIDAQIVSVEEVSRGTDQLLSSKNGIIDINSSLRVKLDRDQLLLTLGRNVKANSALIEKVERLNFILENQVAILQALDVTVQEASQSSAIDRLGKYAVLMGEFYDRVERDEELRERVNELFDEHRRNWATIDRNVYPTGQAYVLKKLGSDQQEIVNMLRNSNDVKRSSVQLVAWLNENRVHIENFDQYALGEFYEVPRWVTTFSDDDIRAFEKSRDLANRMNILVDQNTSGLRSLLSKTLKSVDCIPNLVIEMGDKLDSIESIAGRDRETLIAFLEEAKKELEKIAQPLSALASPGGGNPLKIFNTVQQQILDAIEGAPPRIGRLMDELPQSLRSHQTMVALIKRTRECVAALEQDAMTISQVYLLSSALLSPLKQSAGNALEIGDEVYSFTIEDIPEAGFIDLKYTGQRRSGDQLILKLIVKSRRDSVEKRAGTVVERLALDLQQVSLYMEPHVTVIVANPYNKTESVKLDRNFQIAPSGNFVLKFGSRKSNIWNFLSPGIAFSMSTPDFDLDGTPDIAVGGGVTLLKDIFSAGVSYNLRTDNPMLFFGLSLPFANLGFPIMNTKSGE